MLINKGHRTLRMSDLLSSLCKTMQS